MPLPHKHHRSVSRWIMLGLGVCVVVCVMPKEGMTQTTTQRIGILTAPECDQGREAGDALRQEITIRLARTAQITSDTQDVDWLIQWQPSDQGCEVKLTRGSEEIATMPLASLATESTRTNVVVRMVWFMVTTEPKLARDESVRSELAKIGSTSPSMAQFPTFPAFVNRIGFLTLSADPAAPVSTLPPIDAPASVNPPPMLMRNVNQTGSFRSSDNDLELGLSVKITSQSMPTESVGILGLEADLFLTETFGLYSGVHLGGADFFALSGDQNQDYTFQLSTVKAPLGFHINAWINDGFFLRLSGEVHGGRWEAQPQTFLGGDLPEGDTMSTKESWFVGAGGDVKFGYRWSFVELGVGVGLSGMFANDEIFPDTKSKFQNHFNLFTRFYL